MIQVSHLTKTFFGTKGKVEALKDVNFTVENGDIYGIIGMSGAGKSTLVRCLNLLENAYEGEILFDGVNLKNLSAKELREKRKKIAMIFQGYNLLMQKTCLKNVTFALELCGIKGKAANERALNLLKTVGIEDKENAYPSQLSGGQCQRVAIARALACNPNVLLLDEATSALDPSTTKSILSLIKKINRESGITVIIITHQMSVVEETCNKVTILESGSVAESGTVENVFSFPKSKIAKKLVFPELEEIAKLFLHSEQTLLKIVFNGAEAADKPIISSLAKDTGVEANIIYAQTKSIENKAYGTMILGIKERAAAQKAIEYLNNTSKIFCKEIKENE